jgi:PTS system nitrogen regulatory IIA component
LERFMSFIELISPQAVIPSLKANSKKQALQDLAVKAAEITGRPEREILDVLMQREKLGSTALGAGIAIPHGKLPKLDRIHGVFARLERPIDFEALDGQPVDLVFVLLAPESAGADHLKALSRIARLLRDQNLANQLRDARDAAAIHAVLAKETPPAA